MHKSLFAGFLSNTYVLYPIRKSIFGKTFSLSDTVHIDECIGVAYGKLSELMNELKKSK